MTWAAVAIGGAGLVAGTAGSFLSGQASGRDARQARDFQDRQGLAGQARLGSQVFGPEYGNQNIDSLEYAIALQRGDTEGARRALARVNSSTQRLGGTTTQQLRDLAGTVSARQTGNLRHFDEETGRLAGEERSGIDRVLRSAGDAEREARNYGIGSEATIRRDAGRRLTDLNRATTAGLASRGLNNSTLVGNQVAGNTAAVGESTDRAVDDVRRGGVDRVLAAIGNRTSLQAGMEGDRTTHAYGRSTERDSMEERNLTRDIGLNEAPIQLGVGIQQTGVMNPWLGQNTSAYYPGASGAGNALQAAGALGVTGAGALATGRARSGESGSGMSQSAVDALNDYLRGRLIGSG